MSPELEESRTHFLHSPMRIFFTRDIPNEGLLMLQKKNFDVDVFAEDRAITRDELKKHVRGIDILCPLLTDKIDGEIMDAAGAQLKLIANYAVGFDNIDLAAAKARGITVTNATCPEVAESVAEHAIALMFALSHRLIEVDAFTRAGKYEGWGPKMFLGTDIKGKTIGIIGGGAIGSAIARRLHDGFDVSILYHDIKRNESLEQSCQATYVSKEELLKRADIITLHVPLLPSTHHFIDTADLAIMKNTALLINTARGPVINEKALVAALKSEQIGGAGLDVYECEPMIACTPEDIKDLCMLKNVILTPHTASATIEARQAMSRTVAENIIAFTEGKEPKNIVKEK